MGSQITILVLQHVKLASINLKLHESSKVAVVIATLGDHDEFELMTASIKTMTDEDASCRQVSALLIVEIKQLDTKAGRTSHVSNRDFSQWAQFECMVNRTKHTGRFVGLQCDRMHRESKCYYYNKTGHLSKGCMLRNVDQRSNGPTSSVWTDNRTLECINGGNKAVIPK